MKIKLTTMAVGLGVALSGCSFFGMQSNIPEGKIATVQARMVQPVNLNKAGMSNESYLLSVVAKTNDGERYPIIQRRGRNDAVLNRSFIEGDAVAIPAEQDVTLTFTSRMRSSRNSKIMVCNRELTFRPSEGAKYVSTLRMYRLQQDDANWRCIGSVDDVQDRGQATVNDGPQLGSEITVQGF